MMIIGRDGGGCDDDVTDGGSCDDDSDRWWLL